MTHKLAHIGEFILMLMVIKIQPIFGILASFIGAVYYLSVLKVNVVNKEYGRSWIKYIKSIFK